jgi:hypothetical protein
MTRVNRYAQRQRNAVVLRLEAGDGSIAGMKMFVPIEERCLVAVEVIGIDFRGFANNGVVVLAKPIRGHGTLSVSAMLLVDCTKEAIALYERKSKAAQYLAKNTLKESSSDKTWRDAVVHVRSSMSAEQRKRFDSTAPRFFREGVDMLAGIKQHSSYTLKQVYEEAVWHLFDVEEQPPDEE